MKVFCHVVYNFFDCNVKCCCWCRPVALQQCSIDCFCRVSQQNRRWQYHTPYGTSVRPVRECVRAQGAQLSKFVNAHCCYVAW
jgi:hypothetical protein